MSAGLRRPLRSLGIALGVFAAGAAALAWGVSDMLAHDRETAGTAIAIALGGLAALFGFVMVLNFLWAARLMANIRSGKAPVIGRWTVTAPTMEAFRADEKHRSRNAYDLPRETPPEGVEVIFTEDAVIVGDWFCGLATSGMAHIRSVAVTPGNPLAMAFETAVAGRSRSGGLSYSHGVVRVPIEPTANDEARKVLAHFQAALSGEVLVKPQFWLARIRFGVVLAVVCGLMMVVGVALRERQDLGHVPLVLAVVGAVVGLGAIVLALSSAAFARDQRRGR